MNTFLNYATFVVIMILVNIVYNQQNNKNKSFSNLVKDVYTFFISDDMENLLIRLLEILLILLVGLVLTVMLMGAFGVVL